MRLVASLVLAASVVFSAAARAEDQDSEHLFGFTEGSDLGPTGEKELEMGLFGRFGVRTGRFSAVSQSTELKWVLAPEWRVAPGVVFARHTLRGAPDEPSVNSATLEGFTFEVKRRLLDREKGPFGLTFAAVPGFARIDGDGRRARDFGSHFMFIADRELIEGRLFGAVNVSYGLGYGRPVGVSGWDASSEIGLSTALSWRVADGVFVGGEVRGVRVYDGALLNDGAGQALFAGPNFFARINERMWIAGGWNIQAAGKASGDSARLDLMNFQRHEARLRLGFAF